MQIATETETKYDAPGGFELPSLTGLAGVARTGDPETHELDATYFDTDELHLARHRRTLRRRTGGSDAGWHLKTPGDGSSRTEHRSPLGDDNGDVPAELRAEVRSIVRAHPLRPVMRLRTRRVETPLLDDAGRTLALIAQDEVRAGEDDAEQRWSELEVELVDGNAKLLKAVGKRLLTAGATPAAGPSKRARALGDRLPPVTSKKIKDPVIGYAREQRDAIVAEDPGVEHGDAEAVHRMRVATRRLRSTLKTFKDTFAPERATALRGELKWLADLLGGVRDSQVLTRRMTAAVDREGPDFAPIAVRIRERLGADVEHHRDTLGAALDDTRYLQLLDDLDALVGDSSAGAAGSAERRRARKAVEKADRMLDEATDDEHLHEARKEFKRARYAVEVFVPVVGGPAKALAKRLTELQDVLGEHQDSTVARQLLRDLAGEANAAGENGFPYGVLHARQEQVGEDVLQDLPAATSASRRRKLRRWM